MKAIDCSADTYSINFQQGEGASLWKRINSLPKGGAMHSIDCFQSGRTYVSTGGLITPALSNGVSNSNKHSHSSSGSSNASGAPMHVPTKKILSFLRTASGGMHPQEDALLSGKIFINVPTNALGVNRDPSRFKTPRQLSSTMKEIAYINAPP